MVQKKSLPVSGYEYLAEHAGTYDQLFTPIAAEHCITNINQKIVWQMWWQGMHTLPPIARVCIESCSKNCPPGYRHVIITKDNISDFIVIPDTIKEKLSRGYISITHFSDYVRVCLLNKFGGIWADSTVFFRAPPPEFVTSSNLFYFQSPSWFIYNQSIPQNLAKGYLNLPSSVGTIHSGSSWFIAAAPQTYTLSYTKKILEKYWEEQNKLIDYFLFHAAISWAITSKSECRAEFDSMPKLSNIAPHLLQFSLLENEELILDIFKQSFCHKLTWKRKISSCQEKKILASLQSLGKILQR
ncbi:capsular polysaccharide synthesis protein [Duodenibacillus massiliensis]|uniref:capsular polysaccharide synthesis protein n=2 Tax=Duodenibacillus massiliensis TaxID=1852381 RepID=UPI000938F2E1|nr:capsular polysaccharide synthesis protein [Duodenibacillus massiliensis]